MRADTQTNRQTDTPITILRTPTEGEVIMRATYHLLTFPVEGVIFY